MFLSFRRVAKLALQQFHRNLWLSIATITLLVLPLLVVNLIVSLGVLGSAAAEVVQDKIDVSVYFKTKVANDEAATVRQELLKLPEVKEVEMIGREDALARFKERHKNDPVILESLGELNDNPFGATLTIKAKNPEEYPRILAFLEEAPRKDLIEEKNFEDHRAVISRINTLVKNVRAFGLAVAGIFGAIAILIVVNTVRVAVYTHRNEIGIMRLVGSGNWFIRGPFLFEAFMFSLLSVVLTAGLTYGALYFVEPRLSALFNGFSLSLTSYYTSHALTIFGAQFLGIFFLTALSSFFAVRRYLKV